MDPLNKKILTELQLNGRASYTEIGKKVGLSAPAVTERIIKMEENGIIKGYRAIINSEKIGLHLNVIIRLRISFSNYQSLISKLKEFPQIHECLKLTGDYGLMMKATVKDNKALEDLVDRLSGYGEPNTSVILASYIDQPLFKSVD